MNDIPFQPFVEAIFKVLEEKGKSADIANFLIGIEVLAPSLLSGFLTELSLTAHPEEEVGVGCYSLEHMKKSYEEIKTKKTTSLLEQVR